MNGAGGAVIALQIVESSSGARRASAMKPSITSAVAGRKSMPPTIRVERPHAEAEPGGDAEVAAAAADRPEQVGVGLGVGADELAVGGHDVGREQVVDRQAVRADQEPDRRRRA